MSGSGDMNRRVTLQRATTSANSFNELLEGWTTLAEVWASLKDVSAAEAFRAQEVGAQLTTRFRIRHSEDVASLTPKDRLVYGNATYQVTGVRENKRNRWIEIDCVRRAEVVA
jgi:SPP1 family predicted phage head-tail adaptor